MNYLKRNRILNRLRGFGVRRNKNMDNFYIKNVLINNFRGYNAEKNIDLKMIMVTQVI